MEFLGGGGGIGVESLGGGIGVESLGGGIGVEYFGRGVGIEGGRVAGGWRGFVSLVTIRFFFFGGVFLLTSAWIS